VLYYVRDTLACFSQQPLGFLSGSFKGPLAAWAIVEKEAYSIVESMIRFDYIVGGRHVSLYTDHSNFVYIFDPYRQNPGIARHTASKLIRWAVKLSFFRYTIEAIAGDVNKFADLHDGQSVHVPLSPDWLDL
jgi:RNase H-like domain found in reverse transcriptase